LRLDGGLDALDLLLGFLLQLGSSGQRCVLLRLVVHEDTATLHNTNHAQEEVDSSKPVTSPYQSGFLKRAKMPRARELPQRAGAGVGLQVVLGGDDEAPPRPDQTGGREGTVLGEGQLLGRAREVGDAGQDERPLHDGGPEVHRLEADGAVPHAREPGLLGLLGGRALPSATGRGSLGLPGGSVSAKGGLAKRRPGSAEESRRCWHLSFGGADSGSRKRLEQEGEFFLLAMGGPRSEVRRYSL
jgi:hypothetical protein